MEKLVGLWGGKVHLLSLRAPKREPVAASGEGAIGESAAKNSLGRERRTFYHVSFAF